MDDKITLTLNSPITEEQWDDINDIDFEHIGRVWFTTKHGNRFEFVKASAQPEQKFGKWICHENEDGEPYGYNCSVCGEWYVMPYGKTKFCPNCGAKMEEQDE